MQLKPLNDRVVVKRIDAETVTKAGIVIPDTATEKPDQGRVIAVGKGKRDNEGAYIPLEVKANDRVLFNRYSGTTVKNGSDEFLVLREDDILAVVE